jgi:hypothetical protein
MPEDALKVEVFPIAADRWVAVIDGPAGVFSTEVDRPEAVEQAVHTALREVMDRESPRFVLVDTDDEPWTEATAARQAKALDV